MTYYLPNGEDTCKMGFVWREAGGPMDHTCVTPDGHNQAQLENQHNPRVPLVPVPGHGNANACPGGFVPRDAHGARDTVCVSPSRRAAVVAEDAAANSRRVIDQSFGPDTCKPFFVWREAVGGDHVCVSPELKQQAVDDNRLAASRVAGGGPFGADTCKQGLVWREISQADHVCVLPRVKAKNDEDTKLAAFRRANGPHG